MDELWADIEFTEDIALKIETALTKGKDCALTLCSGHLSDVVGPTS